MRAFRHITLVSVLALGGGGCRVAPSVSVIDSSTKRAASAPIHEAVRRANRGGPAPRWTLEAAQELSGLSVEQYRLGAGPTLLLLPDPASPATTVQVWLPFGWGDEPRGRRGRLRRWAGGWPSSPLGAAHPVEASSGVARDLTRASWTLAAEDLLPVLDTVVAQWPTRTSTPSLSALADLELRMRRALWEASDATARTEPDLDAARAVWAIAGRCDRAAVLRKFRAVARTTLRARPADVPRRAPGRGPRIMLELEGPPARPALLVGWALGASDPETIVGLEALANLLIQTRGSNLLPALGLEGAALSVEAGPAGVSL